MPPLKCPKCGVWPAIAVDIPIGVNFAGHTKVRRTVRCPACGATVEGDPRSRAFQTAVEAWKAAVEGPGD